MRTALALLSLLPTLGFAQAVNLPGSGGFGVDSPYNRLFDPRTVITFSGRVSGLSVSPPMRGMAEAVMMIVKTPNGGSSLVDLGPAWFVNNQDTRLRVGDRVRVTGSKIFTDGRGSILAVHVVKGNRVLALRDSTGLPYWAASRIATVAQAQRRNLGARSLGGRIVQFDAFVDRPFGDPYVVAVVDTGTFGTQSIVLGPRWFIDRQDVQLQVGDTVVIDTWTGPPNSNAPRYAQRIIRGNDVLTLRANDGRPTWAAWQNAR